MRLKSSASALSSAAVSPFTAASVTCFRTVLTSCFGCFGPDAEPRAQRRAGSQNRSNQSQNNNGDNNEESLHGPSPSLGVLIWNFLFEPWVARIVPLVASGCEKLSLEGRQGQSDIWKLSRS